MLRSVKSMRGFTIDAADGEIGKVHEFLFDDELWIIRYLVVDTGTWLPGRKVLLSQAALGRPDRETRKFRVILTRKGVENSPDIDVDRPVSRQQQFALHSYYGWPCYWMEPVYPAIPVDWDDPAPADSHLRSTREVMGYRILAREGEMGRVEDFIVDEQNGIIRYMVVDTRGWLPGKKVLLAPQAVDSISCRTKTVAVNMSKEEARKSPEYDESKPVGKEHAVLWYDLRGRFGTRVLEDRE